MSTDGQETRMDVDNDDNASTAATDIDTAPSLSELPFLVTHWLQNYRGPEGADEEEREDVMERLRNATSEIAAAFSSLGAYGTSSRVSDICYVDSLYI